MVNLDNITSSIDVRHRFDVSTTTVVLIGLIWFFSHYFK